MNDAVQKLRRQEEALAKAEDLLRQLRRREIGRNAYDAAMQDLEEAHRDLEVIADARRDPAGDGPKLVEALAEVRKAFSEQDGKP